MTTTTLLIKNMVCHRCITAVEDILKKEQIEFIKVIFGEIHLSNNLTDEQRMHLKIQLEGIGFEMIDSQNGGVIEKIKQIVIKRARNEADVEVSKVKLSVYIADVLRHEYTYLSSLLKSLTGQTTQQHIHEKLIEKAKEKLSTTTLSVSEIAFELGFEHSQSFSKLFKAKTSLTPMMFRERFN